MGGWGHCFTSVNTLFMLLIPHFPLRTSPGNGVDRDSHAAGGGGDGGGCMQ